MRVEFVDVRKRFGRSEVLRGIDLAIPAGARVALIGPNGSGKSTLIRTLLGLLASDGKVRLDGLSPFEDRVAIAKKLAYVPQVAPQLAAPVEDVVRLATATRGLSRERIVALARRLQLDVDAIALRPFRNLSGGMKQKLLIALALAADASLLVLDEPTASLDADARERFFELFSDLPATTTLLLCSHRLEELRHLASHVVELADGRVAWEGPVEALLARRGRCVVELFVTDDAPTEWLAHRGFRAGASGWWSRTFEQAEKLHVLPELTSSLGGALRNVLVRDLDSIELGRTGGLDAQG